MIGQERTVLPLLATRTFHLTAFTANAHVHRRVRHGESRDELLRRNALGSLWPQAGPRRGLADRPAGAAADHLGAELELDRFRQRVARRESRPHVVDDRHHEDRPRRPRTPRPRHGIQRSRRLRRRRAHRPRDRLHRRRTPGCDPNRSSSASPTPGSASRCRHCSCARRATTPTTRHATTTRTPTRHRCCRPHAKCSPLTTYRERALSSCSQAGLVNNLNDGLAWGLFPIYFADAGLSVGRIGVLAAVYPAIWGLGQLVTGGALGSCRPQMAHRRWDVRPSNRDRRHRGNDGVWTLDHSARCCSASARQWSIRRCSPRSATSPIRSGGPGRWASTGSGATPASRSARILAGVLADTFSVTVAIWTVAALTALSGLVVAVRMYETHRPGPVAASPARSVDRRLR